MTEKELDFLRESNNIEGVWDDLSLQQAILAWQYLINEENLSKVNILKTHRILMIYQPIGYDERGFFRKHNVRIGNRVCPTWQEVPLLFGGWLNDFRAVKDFSIMKNKEMLSRSLHVRFENCHPFADGNGRVGRIIMNWLRIKWLKLPILVIQEAKKQEYHQWFD